MKLTKISERTYELTVAEMPGATVSMVLTRGNRHNFIIDTGVGANSVLPLLQLIKDCKKPVIAINTHKDWDHVYGNLNFENGMIVAHENCRKNMELEWEENYKMVMESDRITDGKIKKVLPNVTFSDKMEFAQDGITLFYTPLHTDCSISVYDAVDKILHIGDNFGFGADGAMAWGEGDENLKMIVQEYEKYDFDLCMSGHSPPERDAMRKMKRLL